jgi:hypothetical protein
VRIQPLAAVCVHLGAAAKRLHAVFPRPAKYTTLRIRKGHRLMNGAVLSAFERTRAYRWRNHIIEEKAFKEV